MPEMAEAAAPKLGWLIEGPIAHRGLHDKSRRIYENTLSAMEAAAEAGYAMECDVQLSADGAAMVFHDADLLRMCGLRENVADLEADDLARLPVLDGDDTVRTLDAMLRQVDGRTPVVIELKANPPHDEGLVEAVLEAAVSYRGDLAVMSFSQDIIALFKEKGCKWPVGLVAYGDDTTADEHRKAFELGISFVSYDVQALPNAFVAEARERGLPVITWTVRNDEEAAKTYEFADQITFEDFEPNTK
jgi:glycerophosphoryl diester phosphodiesterase